MTNGVMSRTELAERSESFIRDVLKARLPRNVNVYLYGSRAREDGRWNSDYDLWIDANLPRPLLREIEETLEESFVPFRVDLVITPQLTGRFGVKVRQEARPWM